MNDTFQHTETMVVETCLTCGMLFAFSADVAKRFRDTHIGFLCPRGHSQYYPAKSDAEILREKLATEQAKLANAQFAQMVAEKKAKRLERRAKNGVCPCCHRQFVSVARHMKSKHPDYPGE